jgi:glycosyltransferase involved in cell wall biosynthesis
VTQVTKSPEVSIVVPIWNDAENIPPFLETLVPLLERTAPNHEIIFCVDPSDDETELKIREIATNSNNIKALFFSARAGQPASTMAGLHHASGLAVIVIDIDLQDPVELIPTMIEMWRQGEQLIIPKRIRRSGEPISKKMTAAFGYYFLSKFGHAPIPRNTGDFRLMDKSVVNRVKSLNESHVFLRGLVALADQRPKYIEFERPPRAIGKTKYNRWFGGIKSGLNGIVSYSTALLDFLLLFGFAMAFLSFGFGTKFAVEKMLGYDIPPGDAQLFVMVTFIGGMQLIGLGLIGLYVGRIYEETKNRPRWFVRNQIGLSKVDINDKSRSLDKSLMNTDHDHNS